MIYVPALNGFDIVVGLLAVVLLYLAPLAILQRRIDHHHHQERKAAR